MMDSDWAKTINTWLSPEDVGLLNQWLDGLQKFGPVAEEHGLTKFEGMILYMYIQSLNQLAFIKNLLQEHLREL